MLRQANEPYYWYRNRDDYAHDLGAEDLFLDDLGVWFFEQFDTSLPAFPYLGVALGLLMARWDDLKSAVVPAKPFWNRHYNSKRKAHAGEPRSLLRLDRARDALSLSLGDRVEGPDVERGFDWRLLQGRYGPELFWPRWFDLPYERALWRLSPNQEFEPWSPWLLLPEELRRFQDLELPQPPDRSDTSSGVELPEGWSPTVPSYEILPVEFSTPDLPLRVGAEEKDLARFELHVLDQGPNPTCVAHAVCTALDILRKRKPRQRDHQFFAPADLHMRCGSSWSTGRKLSAVIDELRKGLPASQTPKSRPNYGSPTVRDLSVRDIPRLKAHLAAGWVVVITTYLPEETYRSNAFREFGEPLRPLPGQQRRTSGHAWALVGYEHVDGNQQWKYQGRFIALNSWGPGFPDRPRLRPGLVSLPFSFVYSEGIEAYALRLPSCE